MKGGYADSTKRQRDDQQRIVGRNAHQRRENRAQEETRNHQIAAPHAIGPKPHEWLTDIANGDNGTKETRLRQTEA